jgi:predicted dehydrogenase
MKPRVALIGVSGFAGLYCEDLLKLASEGRITLTTATVINPAAEPAKCEALQRSGSDIQSDFREMLARHRGNLDLCVIPTGIHLHAPMTLAALEAGCHVLVEKPAAATVDEVRLMEAASAAAGRTVAVGYQHMYASETQRLKKALLDGLIGDIRLIKCLGLWPRDAAYYSRNDWAGKLKVGDRWVLDAPFNNAFAHWLNLMLFLAGTSPNAGARPVSVEAELYRTRPIPSADTACLRVLTEPGIPILFWVSHSCENDHGPVMEICGSRGSVRWTTSQIVVRTAAGESVFAAERSVPDIRRQMLQAVLDRIAGGDAFICDLAQAGLQTLCTNAVFACANMQTIPPEFLLPSFDGQEPPFVIRGMEKTCREAFAREHLWNEMPTPWSSQAGKMTWTQFPKFPGLAKTSKPSPALAPA